MFSSIAASSDQAKRETDGGLFAGRTINGQKWCAD
jgi:hypothetical protein